MKIRMKKLISLGLIVSIFSNSLLIVRAENSYQNNTESSTIYSEMYSIDENMEYGYVKETREEKQTEQPIDKKDSTSGQNELELQNKKGFLISSEKIELQVGEKARFYIISMSDNSECFPVLTLSDSSLAQISEVALEQASEEENGKALLENAPSNAKWYEVTANAAGNVSVTVEYEGVQKEIEILIHGAEIDKNAEENTAHENETILSQRISDGWSQDGLYYYIDGVPVKGIAEIKGVLYYFDAATGRLCKKAQWIDQDGKRYFCNAEGILYRNQFIKFGTIYYYMGSDGSMQTGIVKANDGRLYYIGEDGTVQKKAQWIEQDGKRYFCNAEGILYQNRFIKFGDTYYYCGNDAAIVKGTTQAVNGVLYRFDSNGIMIKEGGWGEYKGNKYYKNPATGFPYKNQWVTFGRIWYYANSNGFMVSGWQTIGGYKYYFYYDTKYMARNAVIEGIKIGDDGRVVAYGTRMSSFTTVSTNNANGTYNMSKALKSFNQVVIQPGQTISFFDIAGPCGKAEGYLPAGVVGGIGYGGGICQASTTLYGAALRAGLTIVERRNHSVPSTYVPIGQDAMVNYGSSDLKIRNDFNFPVKLVTYTKGKTLYAEVWGTQPSWYDYISIESWWSGSRSAVAYRKYIKNGQVVKTEQLPSSYY